MWEPPGLSFDWVNLSQSFLRGYIMKIPLIHVHTLQAHTKYLLFITYGELPSVGTELVPIVMLWGSSNNVKEVC